MLTLDRWDDFEIKLIGINGLFFYSLYGRRINKNYKEVIMDFDEYRENVIDSTPSSRTFTASDPGRVTIKLDNDNITNFLG